MFTDPPPIESRVAVVTTLRASAAVVRAFVAYYLNSGVEHLFLYFDDPHDAVASTLGGLSNVIVQVCTEAHYARMGVAVGAAIEERQRANANEALERARGDGIDWLIHVDSDELVHAERGIARALSRVPPNVDVVTFSLLEAVPSRHEYELPFREISAFRVPARRVRRIMARLLGCGPALFRGEYLRGHYASKSAVRVRAPSLARMDIHAPTPVPSRQLTTVVSVEIALLHFESCGFSEWASKWARRFDGTATQQLMRRNRRRQGQLYRSAVGSPRALARAFERLYFIPARIQWRLRRLGMLRDLQLDPRLFELSGAVRSSRLGAPVSRAP
jgi:hypothetical protein